MPDYVIDPPPQPVVPGAGEDAGFFPVRRILSGGPKPSQNVSQGGPHG